MTDRARAPEAALAGQTIAHRYDVLELLGTGGMGAVYRARDRELDELVALKLIRHELAGDTEMIERFRHEVKLARRVTHVNVARTFELGSAGGLTYCTMELVDGEPLTRVLLDRRKLPVGEAVAIAAAMCDGLAAAHAAGVVHRDIKPDNVLVARDGRVVLADFGVAAIGVAEGEFSGTPAYMAPEQARGEPPAPAADVYAVGIVLAEMLTGRRAFTGDIAKILEDKQAVERVIPGDLDGELAEVIGRATARSVSERFGSAAALRRALAPWVRSLRPPTAPHRTPIAMPELHAVVVRPPRTMIEGMPLHRAGAIQEALLARLRKLPRLRVLPRPHGTDEPDATVVTFDVEAPDEVVVAIARPDGPQLRLVVPATIERVPAAADAIVRALEMTSELAAPVAPADATQQALELVLRARYVVQSQVFRTEDVIADLERALVLAPAHPVVLSAVAIAKVRFAFFYALTQPGLLDDAGKLARAALAAAPDVAEAHLAVGHLELNLGDPVSAAAHFRQAIACAPYSPEAHEQLGRLLFEAGYIDAALARLHEAIAIAPNLGTARWEIARAQALVGDYAAADATVDALVRAGADRIVSRSRFAWWRGDVAALVALRPSVVAAPRLFVPGLLQGLFEVFLDGAWATRGESLMELARSPERNRRRSAFVAQLVAEAAAFAGDTTASLAMIASAVDRGLFDLHWLDHCVLLDNVRARPELAPLRAIIKARAEAVFDALYGDRVDATSDTMAAAPGTGLGPRASGLPST